MAQVEMYDAPMCGSQPVTGETTIPENEIDTLIVNTSEAIEFNKIIEYRQHKNKKTLEKPTDFYGTVFGNGICTTDHTMYVYKGIARKYFPIFQ